jgi:pilus assembly protein CpaB
MNPKRILIALTLAVMVSGAGTWIVSRKLTGSPQSQIAPSGLYVAPSRDLQAGEFLRPGNTELVAWPGNIPIDGAFSRIADLNGRAVLFPLAKGQPILSRDLSAPGSGSGLAAKIPDGMRAVALHSDEIVGVAGFLLPGSHLDVLVTYRPDGSPEPLTATVLQNVAVLAVGHQSEPDPDGKSSDGTVVTLLLTPKESQRAVLASTQGAIHFVLRNGGDAAQTESAPLLLTELVARPTLPHRASPPLPAPNNPAPPKRIEIETILGGVDVASIPTPRPGVAGQ